MADDKILSLLGFARRAGKLSMGHDAAQQALFKKQAKLVLCVIDGSAPPTSDDFRSVGVAKDASRVNFSTITRILWAWVLTLPVSMFLGYCIYNVIVWLLPVTAGTPA